MRCDIIIPVWNLKHYTEQCVESIIRNTDYPYRLIIIDNGSEKKTKEYLESLKNDKRLHGYILIRNEENQGYTIATNQGLEISDAPYVCLHNNDTIACKGWLSEMVRVAESNKEIGIVNPNSNNLGARKPWWMGLEKYTDNLMREYKGQYIEMATAIGFCYLIKREVINKIGILKVGYGFGNFEDTEYCIRAFRNGYKSVFSRGSYVWHAENASFDLVEEYEEMFKKNQKMFYEMFGKPQRILYILTKKDEPYFKKLQKDTYAFAQKCNWVWVISMRRLGKIPLNVHTNIIRFRYWPLFFRARCIFRVLVKKKKFDNVLTDDRFIFSILTILRRFHKGKVIDITKYIYLDDSQFLKLNLGCFKRPCYGYVNIDEHRVNKRVIKASFLDLPLEDKTVKNILLDYNVISEKTSKEIDIILSELERVAVPGCILSIDNLWYGISIINKRAEQALQLQMGGMGCSRKACFANLKELLSKHNFIPISRDYNKVFSVKSFIYKAPYVKDDPLNFLGELRLGSTKLKVLNEIILERGEYVNFFDKASIAQILTENGYFIDLLEVKDGFIEIALSKNVFSSNIIAPEPRKRICAIGQFMLLRYAQLGFDWDSLPRSFEKLGMDYLLLDTMRNAEYKKLKDAILSFRPHYLLVILKDNMDFVRGIREELISIGTKVVYWFCDPEHPKAEDFSGVIDVMFLTNRGQIDEYKKLYNLKRVYYMPQGYGPYIQHRLSAAEKWDVGFSGAISNEPLHKTRRDLVESIKDKYNLRISNTVRNNIAEFYSHSKIVFGASDFDYELYTSNRFFVALGCGACYITKRFKGIELLAENKKHILWFEDKKELFDILDYYLSHDAEREKIKQAAEKLALEKHTYDARIRNVLDILEGKTDKFYGFL